MAAPLIGPGGPTPAVRPWNGKGRSASQYGKHGRPVQVAVLEIESQDRVIKSVEAS